jgi:large subunit ribosomal protein L22
MIEGHATARYVRTSAQKAKLVLDLIRGHKVDAALTTLRFARKGVARDIAKVLRSAISNVQQLEGASGETDRLFVYACYANQGPSQKRVRPAPMGRAFRITKRTAHLTVSVRERPETVEAVKANADAESKTARAKPVGRVTKKRATEKHVSNADTEKRSTTKKAGTAKKRAGGRTPKG